MSSEQIRLVFFIIVITLLSGVADSWAFVHSAKIWQDGKLGWLELEKAALGFGIGISLYWVMLKYMTELGVVSPEIQSIFWFGVTLVGTAFISGAFWHWQRTEQAVAVSVLIGIGWLILRTNG